MSGNGFCGRCGAALGEGMRFCENCGHPIGGEAGQAEWSDAPLTGQAASAGGRARGVYLGIGGGVVALALAGVLWGQFGPQAGPPATQAPRVAVATRTARATSVAPAPATVPTSTKAPVPAIVSPTAVAESTTEEGVAVAALFGEWEIVDGPTEMLGERLRIWQEENGRTRLRVLSPLDDIEGIVDIQQFYLDVAPVGDEFAGDLVTYEDGVELAREAISLSYLPKAEVLTITNVETDDTLVARLAR